jgi:signal transduction histidine kinase
VSSQAAPPTQISERLLPTKSTDVISAVSKIGSFAVIATPALGIVFDLRGPEFELSRLWGPLLVLVVIVCLTAYLAISRFKVKRQLLLLQEITSLSNPHFGADRTIASVMERLRAFYGAASCVLIMADAGSSNYRLRRVDCHGWDKALHGEAISEELNRQLRGLLSPKAVVYSRGSHVGLQLADRYHEIEVVESIAGEPAEGEASDKVATMLEAESFLAVPLFQHNRVAGRLYLASQSHHTFGRSDARLVYQIIVRIFPIIENIRLADRLASEAAERERRKIACDIHDSVIQPYVGIQLGLTALRRKIQRGETDLDEEINTLMEMTDGEIFGLRRYMARLTGTGVTEITLLESVRSFARKFSNASGIPVEIRNGSEIKISDRLAEEAFQMIVEGLSNIRRHTRATRAVIQVGCDRKYFALQIEDEGSLERTHPGFIPRSITTRARALGGQVQVQQSDSGRTAISITIPL